MNAWSIPNWLEQEVRARDRNCVYCGIEMIQKAPRGSSRKALATWEHIINDARIVTRENIALCCSPCNSSKGEKLHADWIQSPYCIARGINKESAAQIVKAALQQATNSMLHNSALLTSAEMSMPPFELQLALALRGYEVFSR